MKKFKKLEETIEEIKKNPPRAVHPVAAS